MDNTINLNEKYCVVVDTENKKFTVADKEMKTVTDLFTIDDRKEHVPIEINLVADMTNIMRNEMGELGYKVNIPDEREVMIYYFTICNRIVKTRPRQVHEALDIVVPESRKAGYNALKTCFEKGYPIMPYLSKKIKGLKFPDKMLFDWGIHHFHLGNKIEKDGFVKQHDEIVYAIVNEDDVYFIDVLEHDHWSDKDLLEKVLSNWPHLLDSFRIEGTPTTDFKSKDIAQLRKANINTILVLSDGHGYMGRGMGMTAAGTSTNATIFANKIIHRLRQIEMQIKDKSMPEVSPLFREGDEICFKEKATGRKYVVFKFQSLKMMIS